MKKNIIITILVAVLVVVVFILINNTSAPSDNFETSVGEVLGESAALDISSEMVVYHESTQGYLAEPSREGVYPGVILIHEWWGMNQNMKDLADDFAEQGYVALVVDLYDGVLAKDRDKAGKLAGFVRENPDGAFSNLESATTYLAGLANVNEDSLASVGWCFGGQWAYNMAANDMGIDASVMYYGRFSMEDDLSMMKADILGHFGQEDRSIAIDDVRQFEAKLKTLKGDHSVFIYPNAGHAFANEDQEDAYNEEAANLAWERTLDFLARELEVSEN